MYSFSIILSKPDQRYWLYTLPLVAGLVWLELYLLATLLLVIWTILSLGETVLEVNAPTRSYRSGLRIFGVHMSGWKLLPARAQRVVVRHFSAYSISGTDGGGEKAHRYVEYVVLLSLPGSAEGFIFYRDYSQERAADVACRLGDCLELEVVVFDQYKAATVLREALSSDTEKAG